MKSSKKDNLEKNIDKKDILKYLILIFIVGSFIGFIYEEIFTLIVDKEFEYRGFLYGPYLPVYGFGSLLLINLKKFKKNPILVFILAMLITGILEYLTGFLMFKIWNRTWWDYTGLFLNIDGYVCLRSVITFAIGAWLLIYLVNPFIIKFVNKKNNLAKVISIIFVIIIIIDFILTLIFRY